MLRGQVIGWMFYVWDCDSRFAIPLLIICVHFMTGKYNAILTRAHLPISSYDRTNRQTQSIFLFRFPNGGIIRVQYEAHQYSVNYCWCCWPSLLSFYTEDWENGLKKCKKNAERMYDILIKCLKMVNVIDRNVEIPIGCKANRKIMWLYRFSTGIVYVPICVIFVPYPKWNGLNSKTK